MGATGRKAKPETKGQAAAVGLVAQRDHHSFLVVDVTFVKYSPPASGGKRGVDEICASIAARFVRGRGFKKARIIGVVTGGRAAMRVGKEDDDTAATADLAVAVAALPLPTISVVGDTVAGGDRVDGGTRTTATGSDSGGAAPVSAAAAAVIGAAVAGTDGERALDPVDATGESKRDSDAGDAAAAGAASSLPVAAGDASAVGAEAGGTVEASDSVVPPVVAVASDAASDSAQLPRGRKSAGSAFGAGARGDTLPRVSVTSAVAGDVSSPVVEPDTAEGGAVAAGGGVSTAAVEAADPPDIVAFGGRESLANPVGDGEGVVIPVARIAGGDGGAAVKPRPWAPDDIDIARSWRQPRWWLRIRADPPAVTASAPSDGAAGGSAPARDWGWGLAGDDVAFYSKLGDALAGVLARSMCSAHIAEARARTRSAVYQFLAQPR